MVGATQSVAAVPETSATGGGTAGPALAEGKPAASAAPFADLITDAVGQVNQLEAQA